MRSILAMCSAGSIALVGAMAFTGATATAAINVNTTVQQSDIGSDSAVVLMGGTTAEYATYYVLGGTVDAYNPTTGSSTPVSGKTLPTFTTNFSNDHLFQLNLQAPRRRGI